MSGTLQGEGGEGDGGDAVWYHRVPTRFSREGFETAALFRIGLFCLGGANKLIRSCGVRAILARNLGEMLPEWSYVNWPDASHVCTLWQLGELPPYGDEDMGLESRLSWALQCGCLLYSDFFLPPRQFNPLTYKPYDPYADREPPRAADAATEVETEVDTEEELQWP